MQLRERQTALSPEPTGLHRHELRGPDRGEKAKNMTCGLRPDGAAGTPRKLWAEVQEGGTCVGAASGYQQIVTANEGSRHVVIMDNSMPKVVCNGEVTVLVVPACGLSMSMWWIHSRATSTRTSIRALLRWKKTKIK